MVRHAAAAVYAVPVGPPCSWHLRALAPLVYASCRGRARLGCLPLSTSGLVRPGPLARRNAFAAARWEWLQVDAPAPGIRARRPICGTCAAEIFWSGYGRSHRPRPVPDGQAHSARARSARSRPAARPRRPAAREQSGASATGDASAGLSTRPAPAGTAAPSSKGWPADRAPCAPTRALLPRRGRLRQAPESEANRGGAGRPRKGRRQDANR